MQFDFIASMRKASDAELIKIISVDRQQYQEDAVAAAEAEIALRNIPATTLDVVQGYYVKEREIADRLAATSLELQFKLLAFFFPYLFQLVLAGYFSREGYIKKAAELSKWTIYGLGFYLVLLIILFNL